MNNKEIEDKLLEAIGNASEDQTLQTYSQQFDMNDSESYPKFVQIVAKLEREGKLQIHDDGTLTLVPEETVATGTIKMNRKGFGFVKIEDQDDDVHVGKGKTGGAMNGDTVTVKITTPSDPSKDQRPDGEIISVDERKNERLTGTFSPFSEQVRKATGFIGQLTPQNKGCESMNVYVNGRGLHPVEGEVVVVDIETYPTNENPMDVAGPVIETIGYKDAPGVDMLTILEMYEIPVDFPDEVIEEANEIPETIDQEEINERKDYRSWLTITIDGADSKDLDDAVSLTILPNGNYQLGVHIADVSYYVTPGSAIDQEALKRGTSVYLTDRVVPMLPQRLSNGICSLNPDEDRLTMSCVMEIDHNGKVVHYDISPSVIHSNYRMVYDDVNAILEDHDEDLCQKYQEIVPMLENMAALHEILLDMRHQRGAVDFDTPEAVISLDDDGHPTDISVRERGVGERLIESFMLAANETIAHEYASRKVPFVYRIHEEPDPDRMKSFTEFANSLGVSVPRTNGHVEPKDLQTTLEEAKDESYAPVLQMVALRTMQQARYDVHPVGHYGLAAKDYTHFTSPIRRYPDLTVHRLIHFYANHHVEGDEKDRLRDQLQEVCDHSSKMERRSVDAEREADSLKKVEYMTSHVGEEFEGIISSVTKFGLFIELDNTVEGLLHISELQDDYYNYIEDRYVLVGQHSGKVYHIGDKIKVKLTKADMDTRQIDFVPVYTEEEKKEMEKHQHHSSNHSNSNHSNKKKNHDSKGNHHYDGSKNNHKVHQKKGNHKERKKGKKGNHNDKKTKKQGGQSKQSSFKITNNH